MHLFTEDTINSLLTTNLSSILCSMISWLIDIYRPIRLSIDTKRRYVDIIRLCVLIAVCSVMEVKGKGGE